MSARILVIGSKARETALVRSRLERLFEVEVEGEPEEGWRRLADESFDAVLLEDGLLETRRVLRRLEEANLGCFLVLFGERSRPERPMAALMAGAFTYLLRPLTGPKVAAALRRGLRNRKKLLGIMEMAADLREANRKLTRQKRKLQEEKRRLAAKTRQLNLINEVSAAAGSTLDARSVVGGVGVRLGQALPLASWAVLFAPAGSERAMLYIPGPLGREWEAELGLRLLARLSRAGGSARGFDLTTLGPRGVLPEAALALAAGGGLILPLLAGGQLIGLYELVPEKPFSPDHFRFAESAANMLALGLKNAWEMTVARRQADRDALTRIANRRAFERQLSREFSRSRRYHQPMTLVMADIDHFKRVNDRYGHPAGDRVLCHVARQLCESVRRSDFVARYGGEEFALILPETGLESSVALAERIKAGVEARKLPAGSGSLGVTLSLGLADTAAPEAEEPGDLVRLADRALYLSKASGRDCISTWQDLTDIEPPLAAKRAEAAPFPERRGWEAF